MRPLRIAIVGRDPAIREEAARAFDGAPIDWHVSIHESPPVECDVVVACPDVDCDGAVSFDPSLPDAVIEAVAATGTEALVIAVTSASGGTGATTIALHLAAAFAQAVHCCLADLDPRWGLRARLGLDDVITWDALLGQEIQVQRACVPCRGGFRALVSPAQDGDSLLDIDRLMDRIASQFEVIVADAPAGNALEAIAPRCSALILVAPPTVAGMLRARWTIDQRPDAPWIVVTNQVGPGGEAARGELEAILGRRVAVELPCAPAVRDAEDEHSIVTGRWSRFVRRIGDLACVVSQ